MTATALLLTALLSAAPDQPVRPYQGRAIVPLSVAAGLFIGGGIFLGVSMNQLAQAQKLELPEREALISSAVNNRVGGVLMLAAGALSTAIAAFLFWYDPASHVTIALAPISGGAVFSLGWTAP